MSVPARQLPTLGEALRQRLLERRSRPVPVLPLHEPRPVVRLRRAEPVDAPAIHALLEQYVAAGLMLPRTVAQIHAMIRDFVIVEAGGEIVGCGALKRYGSALAEVSALAVSPAMQGAGVGRRVVEALLEDARALDMERVFALTTQVPFFARLGFAPVPVQQFPEKLAADCATCARRTRCPETAVARLV